MNFNESLVVSRLFAHENWKDVMIVLDDLYEVTVLIIPFTQLYLKWMKVEF